jgi:uncharacterized membrane-anchored protein YhcB (DUF1043 family)
MTSIGWSLLFGGMALVVGALILQFPMRRRRSREQVRRRTDESLETINHYLREMRQQRNDHAERLRNAPDLA